MAIFSSRINLQELDGSKNYANEKGNFECVALVQKTSGIPHTSTWMKGKRVLDCLPVELQVGTVIATFDENGKYPLTARHAALYESHDSSGINVVDQWNSQGMAKRRKIRLKHSPARDVNDAGHYFVVEINS
jgi:hypothetical protein